MKNLLEFLSDTNWKALEINTQAIPDILNTLEFQAEITGKVGYHADIINLSSIFLLLQNLLAAARYDKLLK